MVMLKECIESIASRISLNA